MAAEIAGLSTDVRDFPEGFDTLVGERGITLSADKTAHGDCARDYARAEDSDSRMTRSLR
jgi:ATP-binding cassette subfamily B protein